MRDGEVNERDGAGDDLGLVESGKIDGNMSGGVVVGVIGGSGD